MNKRNKFRIVGDILFYAACALILIASFLFMKSTSTSKSIFGYRFYEVLSGSMEPTIKTGELVFVKLTETDNLNIGDIVTQAVVKDGSVTMTHRIIDIYEKDGVTMYQTQGDNNLIPDTPVTGEAIIGIVVTHLPYAGYFVSFVRANPLTVLLLALAIVIIISSLQTLFSRKNDPMKMQPEMLEAKAKELEEQAGKLRDLAQSKRNGTPRVMKAEEDV